jgi:tight adherence protein B
VGAALLVFFAVVGAVTGGYWAVTVLPGLLAARRLNERLREVSSGGDFLPAGVDADATVLKHVRSGPLPGVDRLVAGTRAGSGLARLIEQAGSSTTPSALIVFSLIAGVAVGVVGGLLIKQPIAMPIIGVVGAFLPILWLGHKRRVRLKKFEEQFPEALDLVSRALRAGHAFQSAMGMVASELADPVGPEFKKMFDQQNFGLPLRDALNELAERVPLLDVRFFITAVLIQRDTGGNLAEILDNLAHVVRERFKILRQVRVHTAHGRFTAWVLLALPAALAVALQVINPDHMQLLFHERMGQLMIVAAIVMETVGYVWIRQVIKIEV